MNAFSLSLVFIIGTSLLSNSFEIVGDNVRIENVISGKNLDISQIEFRNTTDHDIQLGWSRISNTFPKEWDYSMCAYGECQIGIPEGKDFKIIPAGELGFIAIHVFPKGHIGEGKVEFKIKEKDKEIGEIITFKVVVR